MIYVKTKYLTHSDFEDNYRKMESFDIFEKLKDVKSFVSQFEDDIQTAADVIDLLYKFAFTYEDFLSELKSVGVITSEDKIK